MRRLRSDESGFSLPELILGSALMLIVLAATLATFTNFEQLSVVNNKQNESQDMARNTMVLMARQLRNLAGPDEGQPQAFDKVSAYDIVFKSVNRIGPPSAGNLSNVQRVRYCLDDRRRVWTQVQQWTSSAPPEPPASGSCPDPAWPSQRLVAKDIVNTHGGADRALFVFDTTDPTAVSSVRANLWVDVNPGRRPGETQLESGVFLRNQNQVPLADFQASPGSTGRVILNASASVDPEGAVLSYTWKNGAVKLCSSSVVVCEWNSGAGTHSVTLEVRDPAGLIGSVTKSVTVA